MPGSVASGTHCTIKLKVDPNYMTGPSIIILIFLNNISPNCLQMATVLILLDKLAFFKETKFVNVAAEVKST
jgi:hypothetical protein